MGAGEAGRGELSLDETWAMGPWRACLRVDGPLPPGGQVSEQAGLAGGWGGEEKNEPRVGGGQCSVGCPSGSKVAVLMPPLWSLPSAGWEQPPLPLSPGPRASLYPHQALNWPRLGEGSGGQGPICLPAQGTVGPLWGPWGIGTVKEPTRAGLALPPSVLHPTP